MPEILTYIVFILSVGMTAAGILLSTQLRREYQNGFTSALIYLQVFVFAFGFYGMWGQVFIDQFMTGYLPDDTNERVTTVQALMGLPFMVLSWFMLLRLSVNLLGKKVNRGIISAFYAVHLGVLFLVGYIAFEKADNPQDIYIYYYCGFCLFSHITSGILLLTRPASKSRVRSISLRLLSVVVIVSAVIQCSILLIFETSGYFALAFVFVFYLSYALIPVILRYSAILKNLAKTDEDSLGFEAFCQKHEISQREKEIISELCKGLTNKEIADKLFISLQTVKDHTHRIYIKTGLRNRVELVNRISSTIP
jgi:DNA-binding CsgD family transcriptional regulator